MFGKRGQGSLEYLLLIGGAVLVAAIVIALVVTSAGQGQSQSSITSAAALCASTQNIPGTANIESKTISGVVYYCCSNMDVNANAYFKGAYLPATAPTAAAQVAPVTTCTLAR